MSIRIGLLLTAFFSSLLLPPRPTRKKNLLPTTVPKARTVLVLIDPDAGISVTDPAVNKTARDDVEQAIYGEGRLLPVLDGQNPDLIIVVRKGQGKLVEPTIGGVPNDNARAAVSHKRRIVASG